MKIIKEIDGYRCSYCYNFENYLEDGYAGYGRHLEDEFGNKYCSNCVFSCDICAGYFFSENDDFNDFCGHLIGPCCVKKCKCDKPYCEDCNVITCNCYHEELNKYIIKELTNVIVYYLFEKMNTD